MLNVFSYYEPTNQKIDNLENISPFHNVFIAFNTIQTIAGKQKNKDNISLTQVKFKDYPQLNNICRWTGQTFN